MPRDMMIASLLGAAYLIFVVTIITLWALNAKARKREFDVFERHLQEVDRWRAMLDDGKCACGMYEKSDGLPRFAGGRAHYVEACGPDHKKEESK